MPDLTLAEKRKLERLFGMAWRYVLNFKPALAVSFSIARLPNSSFMAELGFELWIGDPAEIAAKRVKKRKTDVRRMDLNPRANREAHGFFLTAASTAHVCNRNEPEHSEHSPPRIPSFHCLAGSQNLR